MKQKALKVLEFDKIIALSEAKIAQATAEAALAAYKHALGD